MRGINCTALWIKALYKCSPFTISQWNGVPKVSMAAKQMSVAYTKTKTLLVVDHSHVTSLSILVRAVVYIPMNKRPED